MSQENHIELRHLTKRFPSGDATITVLDCVDLTIAAGETVAIVGPSGSGKSSNRESCRSSLDAGPMFSICEEITVRFTLAPLWERAG